MRIQSIFASAVLSLLALMLAESARGQIVFQDNFDAGISEGSWTVNRGSQDVTTSIDSFADFNYNYADIGIPTAPHSVGGSTRGLRFLVNQTDGVFQGISASPNGQAFTGDFRIRFDLWMNFVGPFPGGGSGTTQMASYGWGTSGTTVQWAATKHSVFFASSGDGGSTQDYRAYLRELASSAGATIDPTTGVYAAGTTATGATDARQDTNPYYASLGGKTAPASQLAIYPTQTGSTFAGALGMAWRDVVIEKVGNSVTWTVDGLLFATVPIENAVFGGENLFVGMFDVNSGSSTEPNDFLNAAIFDNITVQVIPEPASVSMLALAACSVSGARRRRRSV